MKVDSPQFYDGWSYLDGCKCCPFTGAQGDQTSGATSRLCAEWRNMGAVQCPNTPEEYAAACALAEAAEKGAA